MGRRKKQKSGIGKVILVTILLLILAAGAYLGYMININGGGLQGVLATILGQNAEELQDLEPINILVLRY